MKILFVMAALLSSSFAQAYKGQRSIDCSNGNDGLGGYYCVYEVSQCIQPTCEEAAQCIVKKLAHDRELKQVTSKIVNSTPVVRDGESMTLLELVRSDNNSVKVYTQLRKPEWTYKVGQCEPVAIQVADDQLSKNRE